MAETSPSETKHKSGTTLRVVECPASWNAPRRGMPRVVECPASRNEIELSDPIAIPPRKFFGQEITDAERRATIVVSSKC
jgi:hypothetical protein